MHFALGYSDLLWISGQPYVTVCFVFVQHCSAQKIQSQGCFLYQLESSNKFQFKTIILLHYEITSVIEHTGTSRRKQEDLSSPEQDNMTLKTTCSFNAY